VPPPSHPRQDASASTQDQARRILGSAWWAGFTFNGITRCERGTYALVGGEELSDGERDQLLELCRQRLDAFREQRSEEVFAHRSRHRSPISGSVKYRVHRCAWGRCECCGAHEHQRALEVDHIIPKNQGGSEGRAHDVVGANLAQVSITESQGRSCVMKIHAGLDRAVRP
jgi:hypothetical protein